MLCTNIKAPLRESVPTARFTQGKHEEDRTKSLPPLVRLYPLPGGLASPRSQLELTACGNGVHALLSRYIAVIYLLSKTVQDMASSVSPGNMHSFIHPETSLGSHAF